MPCSPKRARLLLERRRAVVHKIEPFTIRLKDRTLQESSIQSLRLKLDPGSKRTGIAILLEKDEKSAEAIYLGEIHHKTGIKLRLDKRRKIRRSRRSRKTRYRKARFLNRKRKEGWLPPSLQARVDQTINLVKKLSRLLPIKEISTEHVKFDTQLMENPEIRGVEYQRGELFGYEVREYLLEKWGRKCAYCGIENVPLEVDHIVPKSRGGTDKVSNLTIACKKCNRKKGNRIAEEFGHSEIQSLAKKPLKDAAMINATRWRLYEELCLLGYKVECATGGRTKKQRIERGFPKTHYYDALCVGNMPVRIDIKTTFLCIWKAIGRGHRRIANTDKGFPKSHRGRIKFYFGFQTGDQVIAIVPKGKYKGIWRGRVAVRKSGYFDLKDTDGKRIIKSKSWRCMRLIQRISGWQIHYLHLPPTTKDRGLPVERS